ncbi:GNAT family N-acetyltransferase [Candidatus Poribacteria bacterium]
MKSPKLEENAPCRRELGDGLVLKTAASEEDIDRVAECHDIVFGEEENIGEMCRRLFLYHPNTQHSDLIFVEDEKTAEVVSSLCLIPWQWRYENAVLKVGEMGIVGTKEEYRRRGLIRAQADYLKEQLMERGFHLSQIQGIPYFYRQFGYEYTLPLIGGHRVELHQVPDLKEDAKPAFTCRLATVEDLPIIKRLYNEAAQDLQINTCRDDAIWKYLWEHSPATETACGCWVVEDVDGSVIGYFRVEKHGFGSGVNVAEVSRLSYEAALTVLRQLKKLAVEREKPYIRLALPKDCALVRTAHYHGANDLGTYAWQIHIPDMAWLLSAIGPALERRLAESPFAGLTEEVKLNFYREAVALHFAEGKLKRVQKLDSGEGSIRIPPRAAVPLVLGYRSREELKNSWPDLGMPSKEAYLIDVLFPRMVSHIYTIY